MKRLKPEEIRQAFLSTGLVPERGAYFNQDNTCACGLGALFAQHYSLQPDTIAQKIEDEMPIMTEDLDDPTDETVIINALKEELDLTNLYTHGFVYGFDAKEPLIFFPSKHAEILMGYEDGLAAWNAVKDLIPHEH